jgi:hypothetical protein
MKKIAIFETSDIILVAWNYTAKPTREQTSKLVLKTTFENANGVHEVYSTGALERALEQGYKVYVASTRERLGDHDAWWISMVGADAVFLAQSPDPENYDETRNGGVSAGWMGVYKELGIPWPTHDGEPEFWTTARRLLSKHGIDIGADFR